MAATVLKFTPTLNFKERGVVPHVNSKFHFYGGTQIDNTNAILSCSSSIKWKTRTNQFKPVCVAALNSSSGLNSHTFDVVIIGAGIIGLTIARQFLLGSNLSVAVVDAAAPCAGATGAGQGYIWKIHRNPGSEQWELAMRSHQLWKALAESIKNQGLDPLQTLGWKETGSLLVGRTANECSVLKSRVELLLEAGLEASFLSYDDLLSEEPDLRVGREGGAAFVPDDRQIDARRTVAFIEKANRSFAPQGRYSEFYYEQATSLLRSESSGEAVAVQTSKNTLYGKKSIIVAAGCWSGSVLHDLIKHSEIELDFPVKPRKGHLLVIENFKSINLNHGLMELGYVNHKSATLSSTSSDSGSGYNAHTSSISMTATMDMSGRLVLGSSRQLMGFNTEIDESIVTQIWERAGEFFPILKQVSVKELSKSREVRVGLRPYMTDGKPVIGHVPGISNMFLAAGHEGEGLTLALGTAEMIVNTVLGNIQKVDPTPYSMY
ncbi:FAD-dependent oxidoreductase family protein [Abeliophyllum distichum]|uniref:FAD-dependent oxidoreductase domain-containing protein 1 n=1 Tax=Abeliophyllum distichum TaxID=126358 RepID=A0ABD1RCT7_9LAMI